MAEFKEVVERYKKICEYYFPGGCERCPFWPNMNCCDMNFKAEEIEKITMEWQPDIYPTILEIVHYIMNEIPNSESMSMTEILNQRIPEKVAKEFGIVPLNINGVTKYCNKE